MYAVVNEQERKAAVGQLCDKCGKNDRGQKYADDKELRHRRFYFDFNAMAAGQSRMLCGPCVKTIGGRCGK